MRTDITKDLVFELVDYASRTGRPTQTAIVLGPAGWDTLTWTSYQDEPAKGLVAITADDIDAMLDGTDLDGDIAESLTRPNSFGPTTYAIPAGDGESEGDDPVVVTGTMGDDEDGDEDVSYADAWIFDRSAAMLIVAAGEWGSRGTIHALWRTEGGVYVRHTQTIFGVEREYWTALTGEQAAEFIYRADDNLVVDGGPTLARAARLVADLVELLVPPAISGRGPWKEMAMDAIDAQTDAVHTARAILHLLRVPAAKDIRRSRAAAAINVWEAFGSGRGASTAAAEHLGMSPQTFSTLVREADERP